MWVRFHSGTSLYCRGQVRRSQLTNTSVFTNWENGRLIIGGEVHLATHDTPIFLSLHRAVRISLLIHWKASGGVGVAGPPRLCYCDSSLAVITSARTRQNTELVVIIDAETAVDGGGSVGGWTLPSSPLPPPPPPPPRSHRVCWVTLAWTRLCYLFN